MLLVAIDPTLSIIVPAVTAITIALLGGLFGMANKRTERQLAIEKQADEARSALVGDLKERINLLAETIDLQKETIKVLTDERDAARKDVVGMETVLARYRPARGSER